MVTVGNGTLDAHAIIPKLFLGSRPPSADVLRRIGFDVVVFCARELQPLKADFAPLHVIHAPNDDDRRLPLTNEGLRIAWNAATEVVDALKDGKRSLVTCYAGLNRSGLVTALALHQLKGWSGTRCIAEIRKHRVSRIRPDLIPLCNRQFASVVSRLPQRAPETDPRSIRLPRLL